MGRCCALTRLVLCLLIMVMAQLCVNSFVGLTSLRADQMNESGDYGVLYFSNGTNLIKYNFLSKKKEMVFQQGEKTEIGKKLTNIKYPVYLKSKNRVLFIGSTPYPDPNDKYIFESNPDLKNMKQYKNMGNVDTLSLSPDESVVAYYRHPNKLIIKRYEYLEKDGYEKILAHNFLGDKALWISNVELVYNTTDHRVVKLNIQNGNWKVLEENILCGSVSPDKKLLLCWDGKAIYSYDFDNPSLKLIKKSENGAYPFEIWLPNRKCFLFSELRKPKFTFDVFKLWHDALSEVRDIYLYNLSTGEENKIMDNEVIYGGFWLDE